MGVESVPFDPVRRPCSEHCSQELFHDHETTKTPFKLLLSIVTLVPPPPATDPWPPRTCFLPLCVISSMLHIPRESEGDLLGYTCFHFTRHKALKVHASHSLYRQLVPRCGVAVHGMVRPLAQSATEGRFGGWLVSSQNKSSFNFLLHHSPEYRTG